MGVSYLRVDSLLVGVPLRLLPLDAGGVAAEGRQLGLLVEEAAGAVDGLLAGRDGGDEGALRLGHNLELLRVLRLREQVLEWNKGT